MNFSFKMGQTCDHHALNFKLKTIVDDYDLDHFLVINYSFKHKVETMISDYSFEYDFKVVVIIYGFDLKFIYI